MSWWGAAIRAGREFGLALAGGDLIGEDDAENSADSTGSQESTVASATPASSTATTATTTTTAATATTTGAETGTSVPSGTPVRMPSTGAATATAAASSAVPPLPKLPSIGGVTQAQASVPVTMPARLQGLDLDKLTTQDLRTVENGHTLLSDLVEYYRQGKEFYVLGKLFSKVELPDLTPGILATLVEKASSKDTNTKQVFMVIISKRSLAQALLTIEWDDDLLKSLFTAENVNNEFSEFVDKLQIAVMERAVQSRDFAKFTKFTQDRDLKFKNSATGSTNSGNVSAGRLVQSSFARVLSRFKTDLIVLRNHLQNGLWAWLIEEAIKHNVQYVEALLPMLAFDDLQVKVNNDQTVLALLEAKAFANEEPGGGHYPISGLLARILRHFSSDLVISSFVSVNRLDREFEQTFFYRAAASAANKQSSEPLKALLEKFKDQLGSVNWLMLDKQNRSTLYLLILAASHHPSLQPMVADLMNAELSKYTPPRSDVEFQNDYRQQFLSRAIDHLRQVACGEPPCPWAQTLANKTLARKEFMDNLVKFESNAASVTADNLLSLAKTATDGFPGSFIELSASFRSKKMYPEMIKALKEVPRKVDQREFVPRTEALNAEYSALCQAAEDSHKAQQANWQEILKFAHAVAKLIVSNDERINALKLIGLTYFRLKGIETKGVEVNEFAKYSDENEHSFFMYLDVMIENVARRSGATSVAGQSSGGSSAEMGQLQLALHQQSQTIGLMATQMQSQSQQLTEQNRLLNEQRQQMTVQTQMLQNQDLRMASLEALLRGMSLNSRHDDTQTQYNDDDNDNDNDDDNNSDEWNSEASNNYGAAPAADGMSVVNTGNFSRGALPQASAGFVASVPSEAGGVYQAIPVRPSDGGDVREQLAQRLNANQLGLPPSIATADSQATAQLLPQFGIATTASSSTATPGYGAQGSHQNMPGRGRGAQGHSNQRYDRGNRGGRGRTNQSAQPLPTQGGFAAESAPADMGNAQPSRGKLPKKPSRGRGGH